MLSERRRALLVFNGIGLIATAIIAGWMAGPDLLRPQLALARRLTGLALLLVAMGLALRAFGIV